MVVHVEVGEVLDGVFGDFVFFAKGVEFFVEALHDVGVFGIVILVDHLVGIGLHVVEFPLFDLVKVHELVASVVDSFVAVDHVPAGVFVVVIVVGGAPVVGCVAFEDGDEAGSLHVVGDVGSGDVEKGLGKVEVGYDVAVYAAGLDLSGPGDEQGCAVGLVIHEALVEPPVFAKVEALVAGVDEDGVL